MKKIYPVLILVCGLFIIAGCPSDPAQKPPPPITDADFSLVDGIYEHTFDNPRMVKGTEYEIIINAEKLDDELGGCHFQGQLLYQDGATKYLLASSQNAQPQNIAVLGKKYRITLKAGEISDEDKTTDKQQAGGYSLPDASLTEVPAGAAQIFLLTAKTPQWYEFGKRNQPDNGNTKDNWDVNYYDAGIIVGIKGDITVRVKPNYTYTDGAAVTGLGGSDSDSTTGKGNIEGAEYVKLKEAPPDSLLRVFCTANVVTSGGGGTTAQPGWGIAEFGTVMGDANKIRGQNQTVGVGIPETWNGSPVTANSNFVFHADILIADILDASDPNWTFLNVYNGGKVTGMTIRVPNTP
ncbi:MAG: hypothetical protein LBH20_02425 [Treponema sp.]|jgi:hypothetical protein|nr:hypothetical protein [Treponema sp.]